MLHTLLHPRKRHGQVATTATFEETENANYVFI